MSEVNSSRFGITFYQYTHVPYLTWQLQSDWSFGNYNYKANTLQGILYEFITEKGYLDTYRFCVPTTPGHMHVNHVGNKNDNKSTWELTIQRQDPIIFVTTLFIIESMTALYSLAPTTATM